MSCAAVLRLVALLLGIQQHAEASEAASSDHTVLIQRKKQSEGEWGEINDSKPWDCNAADAGIPLQIISEEGSSTLWSLDLGASVTPGHYSPLCMFPGKFNACGINPQDFMIYCQSNRALVRLSCDPRSGDSLPATGEVRFVFKGLPGSFSADFAENGTYYQIVQDSSDYSTVYAIDDLAGKLDYQVLSDAPECPPESCIREVKQPGDGNIRGGDLAVVSINTHGKPEEHIVTCAGKGVYIQSLSGHFDAIPLTPVSKAGEKFRLPRGLHGAVWQYREKTFCSSNTEGKVYQIFTNEIDTITQTVPVSEVIVEAKISDSNDGLSCRNAEAALPEYWIDRVVLSEILQSCDQACAYHGGCDDTIEEKLYAYGPEKGMQEMAYANGFRCDEITTKNNHEAAPFVNEKSKNKFKCNAGRVNDKKPYKCDYSNDKERNQRRFCLCKAGAVSVGWCNDWQHASVKNDGLGMAQVSSPAECWQACLNKDLCEQAVYESDKGNFGHQCWLGTVAGDSGPPPGAPTLVARPSCVNNTGCTNECFVKDRFAENISTGWCHQWAHASIPKGGLGMVKVSSADACWQACRSEPRCMQAVYEEGGQFDEQCWLGTNKMSLPPKHTRPSCATTKGCTNQCFGKFGFESPELEKKMDGWCNQWEHASVESAGFDDPVIGLGMVEVVNKGECWKACRDEPRCMQAVYEEGGSFGLQCWLGTSQMSMHPKPTRPNCTATPNCTNQCYGKFGFTGR